MKLTLTVDKISQKELTRLSDWLDRSDPDLLVRDNGSEEYVVSDWSMVPAETDDEDPDTYSLEKFRFIKLIDLKINREDSKTFSAVLEIIPTVWGAKHGEVYTLPNLHFLHFLQTMNEDWFGDKK